MYILVTENSGENRVTKKPLEILESIVFKLNANYFIIKIESELDKEQFFELLNKLKKVNVQKILDIESCKYLKKKPISNVGAETKENAEFIKTIISSIVKVG